MSLVLQLVLTGVMTVLPSLMFVGLWNGLQRMQESGIVQRTQARMGDNNTTSIGGKSCSECGAENPVIANYCRSCVAPV